MVHRMFLLLLAACRQATVVDACLDEPDLCPACAEDADCALGGNACTETVYCLHEDATFAVIQIGCSKALEYDWPPADTCGCIDTVCQSTE